MMARLAAGDILIWDGSSSGYWNTGANWNTGTVPQDGDDLVFPSGPTRLVTTNNTSSLRRYRSITISGDDYILRGNSITLSNGVSAATAGPAANTIENDITLAASQEFQCSPTLTGVLTVRGDISLGAHTLTLGGAGRVLLGGVISGTGGITKDGTGLAYLYGAGANTYSGTTRVRAGTLFLQKDEVNAMAGDLVVGDNSGIDMVRWGQCCQLPSTTFVSVTNKDFPGNRAEAVQLALDATEGFTFVLAGAKALLEHNIQLNLVRDRFPDGLGK